MASATTVHKTQLSEYWSHIASYVSVNHVNEIILREFLNEGL